MGFKIDTRSISVQLIALVLIVALVPILVLTYNSYSTLNDQANGYYQDRASNVGAIGKVSYEKIMEQDRSVALELAVDNQLMADMWISYNPADAKKVIDKYAAKYPNINIMTVVDANGVTMARSATDKAGDKTTNPIILKALAGNEFTGSDVLTQSTLENNNLQGVQQQTGTTGALAIVSALPIYDDKGKLAGAIYVGEVLNTETSTVDQVASDANGFCTFFQGDIRVATNLKDGSGNRILGTKAPAGVSSAVLSGQTVQVPVTINNVPYFWHYEPIKDSDGKIVGILGVGYDVSGNIAAVNNSIYMSVGIGAVIAILAVLSGFFVVRRTTRPINRLVDAANSVAKGNLETSMETGANGGEIGELTQSISKMVMNIKDRIMYNESVLKGIMDPLYVADVNGNLTYVNEPGAKMMGSSVTGLSGRKFGDLFTNLNSSESYLAKCLRTGEPQVFEAYVQIKANGNKIYLRGSNAPIKDTSGRVTGVVELLQDMTNEKDAQEAIKKAEQVAKEKALFSDSILKAITDSHIVSDTKGNVTYINAVAQKLLAISERDAIGRPLGDVIGNPDSKIVRTAQVERQNVSNMEGFVTSHNGNKIPVLVNMTQLMDASGNFSGVNAMFKDITKEKESKKQLAEITLSANKIAERVAGASGNVSTSVGQVMSASRQISESIQQIASGSQTQAKSIEGMNKLMHEMSDSISTVRDGAKKTSEDAVHANAEARKGSESAKVAIRKMDELHVAVNDSAKIVQDLGEKSAKIGQIVEMITAIAGQTNLLALNAAIEAARAGDAGRGFAVVAEEVRKLAEESAKAAEEINALIGEVRGQTARAVESMNKGTHEVDESNKIVAESLKSLEDIGRLIDTTAAKAQEIASMTEKQAADTQKVVKGVEEMAAVIEESAAGAEEVSASSEETTATAEQVSGMAAELAKIAEELKAEVGKLKVE